MGLVDIVLMGLCLNCTTDVTELGTYSFSNEWVVAVPKIWFFEFRYCCGEALETQGTSSGFEGETFDSHNSAGTYLKFLSKIKEKARPED